MQTAAAVVAKRGSWECPWDFARQNVDFTCFGGDRVFVEVATPPAG